ncbi:hypothetical protein [Elizabethkingia meningoseptica]|uniref:hypothetical protein n=3 Tax=Bacteroidota TaxID=976 RepID=UPI001626EB88|nr:hypothetical protein [Elizabethkingia meningoseptica]
MLKNILVLMKIYRDSKDLPLSRYERIMTTGSFLFLLRDYQDGDEVNGIDEKKLESHFKEIIQEYIVSLNNISIDFSNYGKLKACRLEIPILYTFIEFLNTIKRLNIQWEIIGESHKSEHLDKLFDNIQIKRTSDIDEQIKIVYDRIEKFENDIASIEAKIKKTESKDNSEPTDINDIITNVELVLETSIDIEKISLYRFGVKVKQARKRIDEQIKIQNKRK